MIAKLITWGRDRDEARRRMARALEQFDIGGVPSTVTFHHLVMTDEAFAAGGVPTTYLTGLDLSELTPYDAASDEATPTTTPTSGNSLQTAGPGETFVVDVNNKRFTVRVAEARRSRRATREDRQGGAKGGGVPGTVTSPMHGVVLRVAVAAGQEVAAGDLLMTVEAMKMENEITAPRAGSVTSLDVAAGATVDVGTVLATIG